MDPTQALLMTAAIGVSALSLIVASLSLGWQIAIWLMSAGRIRVTLQHGLLTGSGAAYLAPVNKKGKLRSLSHLAEQEVSGQEVLAIEVVNVGRAPVTVTRYGAHVRGSDVTATPMRDAIGKELPFRLESGEAETWAIDIDSVRRLVDAGQVLEPGARVVDMTVDLATGKKARTRGIQM